MNLRCDRCGHELPSPDSLAYGVACACGGAFRAREEPAAPATLRLYFWRNRRDSIGGDTVVLAPDTDTARRLALAHLEGHAHRDDRSFIEDTDPAVYDAPVVLHFEY